MVAVDEQKELDEPVSGRTVPHFTASERAARGRAAREECPRSSQRDFELSPGRDPVAILEAWPPLCYFGNLRGIKRTLMVATEVRSKLNSQLSNALRKRKRLSSMAYG